MGNAEYMGTHPIFESDFDCLTDRTGPTSSHGSPPSPMLSVLQEQALPQVSILSRCPRPQDPNLRSWIEEGLRPPLPTTRRHGLRRAKFKFPGRQKIFLSKKFGFTKFDRPVFEEGIKTGAIVPDGVTCQYRPNHGPLSKWKRQMA